jgi:hypothetical protein
MDEKVGLRGTVIVHEIGMSAFVDLAIQPVGVFSSGQIRRN